MALQTEIFRPQPIGGHGLADRVNPALSRLLTAIVDRLRDTYRIRRIAAARRRTELEIAGLPEILSRDLRPADE